MRIVLDRQHRGKPNKPGDLGAGFDSDGDGIVQVHEQEAMHTGLIQLAAEARLIELGHEVFPMSHGTYKERHQWANEHGVDVYVALHLNSGPGGYGAVFHDYQSKPHRGPALAASIAEVLRRTCDELTTVKVLAADPRDPDWKRPYYCIRGLTSPIGIVFEPFFMPEPSHASLLLEQGKRRVGAALALGIHQWAVVQQG